MKNISLFNSFNLKNHSLRHRIALAPMTRVSATKTGVPTERMKRYYQSFAKGGFSLVITEGLYTDLLWSQGYLYQPGIVTKEQTQAWKEITASIQNSGGVAIAQLMHAGALSQGNEYKPTSLSASEVMPKGEQMAFYYGEGHYPVPTEASVAQIHQAIEGFADSAQRAIEDANFDGIEIHGANGYFIDQFITSYTNQRNDKFGGDTTGRMTLPLSIIQAVRERVGDHIPVGIRISQSKVNDFEHLWENGEDDAKVIFGLLQDSGVDFIHITAFDITQPAFGTGTSTLIELIKKYAPKVTIIANGGITCEDKANQVLNLGANLITLGKSALANHDWPEKVQSGQPLNEFEGAILGPIADIKDRELI